MTIDQLRLPNALAEKLNDERNRRKETTIPEFKGLIGAEGYTAGDPEIVKDAVIALLMGKNVLLKGPTGSGKTKLAEYLSFLFQQPLHSINCSVDLDAEALLGHKTISYEKGHSEIEFIPGPVTKAATFGHFLYIDEINVSKPETLPILNGILDYRRTVTNPFTGDIVKAAAGFSVIAAINEGYIGTVPLNEALKNRFVVIEVPYIQGETLFKMLQFQSEQKDSDILYQFVQFSSDLVQQTKTGQLSEDAASIRALLDAADLSAYMPPKRAIQRAVADKLEDAREKTLIHNIADTLFV
ncbi:ATP-binding protein [Fictibacillus terranigra]|uniref:MoxR family ATPase n=1 Tax=Fictibacillus terranigra TaxID=3058424 RepID=A0ABT8E5N6_9BACL|nr:MoxR family ATPase [Fictibacillus sp. CENA-BCM004]MDN4073205.1 MoxR family ATPase [Fictibacillus sp. CENA-BCM004]